MKKNSNVKREKLSVLTVIVMSILIIYSIILVGLLVWAFITSFKEKSEFRLNKVWLPKKWAFENYATVYSRFKVEFTTDNGSRFADLPTLFLNGFLYAIGCAFFGTITPMITSYAAAKYDFKFSKVLYTIVLVTMILPIVGSLPSEIHMAKVYGLYDHIWGLWLMKANFLGLYFLVFYASFKKIPNTYIEAAKIDGANQFTIMFKVVLPLVKTLFFTILLLNFITFWNDYSVPLAFLPTHPTIAVGMQYMSKNVDNIMSSVPMRMAAAMLMLLPIFILFLAFHKRLLGNLTMGGIKG